MSELGLGRVRALGRELSGGRSERGSIAFVRRVAAAGGVCPFRTAQSGVGTAFPAGARP